MKEDLYADLTGLIVRGVKREPDEDVYDCIQTGRNGSKSTKPLSSPPPPPLPITNHFLQCDAGVLTN